MVGFAPRSIQNIRVHPWVSVFIIFKPCALDDKSRKRATFADLSFAA
jgi:hypothetical protein